MQKALVNVNGEIFGPEEARISVYDRGYLYGDSIYEVVKFYGGKAFTMAEHLERLEASAKLLYMGFSQKVEDYAREMERTVKALMSKFDTSQMDVYCRIIVSRGAGKIGFSKSCVLTPTHYTIIAQPLEDSQPKPMRLKIVDRLRNDPRALNPALKSGNYLNCVLAYLEAVAKGFDDALLCNADGHLTESTTSNFFYARRGILATPPLDIGILDGITRKTLVAIAPKLGIRVREVRFPKERLYEADEVFVTGTVKEVLPVVDVDGHRIGNGKMGPITEILQNAFRNFVQENLR